MKEIETEEEFEELINENEKVIVDMWAEWCGPCKSIAPHFENLSEEQDDIVFAKVEVDELPDVAKEYSVSSIPTFIGFRDGEEEDRNRGSNPSQLESFVETVFFRLEDEDGESSEGDDE